jgi:MFS transporter, DHA2 family, methylenomycin A resistance protein
MGYFLPGHQPLRSVEPALLMEPESASRFSKPLTLAAMSLGYGVVQLDVTIVNTALNSIGTSLGGGVSQAAAIGMLGILAGAIIEGGRIGWTNPWVVSAFGGFVVLAMLFLLQERRAHAPMLPLSLFRNRMFALTSLVGLLVNVAFYGLIFVFSLYFQEINGWSSFATGLAFVPMMGAVLPVNLIAPRLAERFGAPAIIAAGALIAAAGCLALLGIDRGTGYWAVFAQLLAMGGGLGMLVPPLTSTLLGSVEKARSGLAAGVLNSTRQTGSVLGVALFGSLIAQTNAFLFGARAALIISAVLLIAAAAAIAIGGRLRR